MNFDITKRHDTEDLRKQIEAFVGVTVLAQWSSECPECLNAVVLGDVGPELMGGACDILRRAGDGMYRLCANVLEEHHDLIRYTFDTHGFDAAFKQSWKFCVATVRMG